MVVGATLVHAQGYIEFYGTVAAITTNSTQSYFSNSLSGGTFGKTSPSSTAPNAFDYALLFATSTTAGDSSPLGADWQLATEDGGAQLLGSNFTGAGGLTGPGTSGGVQVNLAASTAYACMLVGWSSALGSTWASVSALLAENFAGQSNQNLFFGSTPIGTITPFSTAGAGDPTLFPATYANSTLTLYSAVPSPEPTTLALAGLGGLSALFLRRRKA